MNEASHQASTPPGWVSYHIFHPSLPGNLVLMELVLPVVRALWSRRRFRRFFFIRYAEGGPHIRLRFLSSPEDRGDIADTLSLHAAEFFERNEALGGNCVIESPFEPETERYGGSETLGHSLDFFCVTSAYVLQQIERNDDLPKSRLLALAMRALLRQTLGFSTAEDEMSHLIAYRTNGEWKGSSPLEERADREFEERRGNYIQLLTEEIEHSLAPEASSQLAGTLLTEASHLLRQRIRSIQGRARWRILSSQLHMTWNRMGIQLLEEIYLGRILWLAVRDAVDSGGELRAALAEALTRPRAHNEDGFEPLVSASLAQLARPARPEASQLRLAIGGEQDE